MAIFNRKKQDSVLPEEVQNYYKAEKRQRTGAAWLLALLTLALTILLAAALFFGGRWVYRTVFDRNDNGSDTSQQAEQANDSAATSSPVDEDNTASSSNDSAADSGNTPSNTPGAVTGGSSEPSTPTQAESELVNTGPGDE